MKEHNDDYDTKFISVEVVKNGFILHENGLQGGQWICHSFTEVVNMLAAKAGLVTIGEELTIKSNKAGK